MKISRILLLPVLIILFGSMISFDNRLKEEYLSGRYNNPMKAAKALGFKNFDVIEIQSNLAGVSIQHSDTFNVSVRDYAKDDIKVTQIGRRLIVSIVKDSDGNLGEMALSISCPTISELKLDAVTMVNGRKFVKTDFSNTTVFLRNFKQDSLKVTMNHASYLKLFDNQIGYLSADIGIEKHSPADMVINKTNKIGSANLNILNNGKMALEDLPVNGNFRCRISDSALVRLTGASLKLIRQE